MSTYNYNIQLQDIHIQNFRGFEEVAIHFDEKLTVFIGINGSGKTSILELLADMLRQYVNRLHGFGRTIFVLNAKKDINFKKTESVNEFLLNINYWDYKIDKEENRTDELELKIEQNICFYNFSKSLSSNFYEQLDDNDLEVSLIYKDIINRIMQVGKEKIHLPVIAYYPCGSLNSNQNSTETDYTNSHILDVYLDFLDNKNVNFKQLKNWFDWRQKLDLQRRDKGLVNSDNAITNQIYTDILKMLNDDEANYESIYIDWANIREGEFVLVKNGAELRENQLSSGEKMLFTLVADISAKMAVANPTSSNPSKDGVGVVLIDEIDLHLHPKWQRKVITKLQEIFPKVQFVVTTHSAMVLQNIKSEHVRVLSNGQIFSAENTYGQSIEDILENTLDTDANLFEKEFSILFDAISNNKIEEAIKIKQELSNKIEGKSAELIRAEALINRKRLLAK